MTTLIFTILVVAEHPCGRLTEHTYQISANNLYQAFDQVSDHVHSYGLRVKDLRFEDTKPATTKGKP
jgi:hypothetical protein